MKQTAWLLGACLLLSVAAWAQNGRADAPKSRKAHEAVVHHSQRHAARQLTVREKQERARMRAEQRHEAKLAKKQRKEAMRRSRRSRKAGLNNQPN